MTDYRAPGHERLRDALDETIGSTDFRELGVKYSGKVRDCYSSGGLRFLVTTDRLSCFDRFVSTIPYKGQVVHALAAEGLSRYRDVYPNHLVDVPDPNVMVGKECRVLPVEVIVRAYIAGGAWRSYRSGLAVSGIVLPPGLSEFSPLPDGPVVTPSTKEAAGGHDRPISGADVVASGAATAKQWDEIKDAALALFGAGSRDAAARGLILVDTKYEFGVSDGKLLVVDEIHTLDSSRYWVAGSYHDRTSRGEPPEMLDKEPTRRLLVDAGFTGEGPVPDFPDALRVETAARYLDSYEKLTGRRLNPEEGPWEPRIRRNLARYTGGRA